MQYMSFFINNYNHCLVSIFSEYADEKNTDYRSCCQYSIHIDKILYKPRKQKGYSLYYYDGVCFIELAILVLLDVIWKM